MKWLEKCSGFSIVLWKLQYTAEGKGMQHDAASNSQPEF